MKFSACEQNNALTIKSVPPIKNSHLGVYLDIAYFAKNWKHGSKIIFKCMNGVVGPIFNECLCEQRGLWVPWRMHETHFLHGTHWKALSTTYFAGQEVVGPTDRRDGALLNNNEKDLKTQKQKHSRYPNAALVALFFFFSFSTNGRGPSQKNKIKAKR